MKWGYGLAVVLIGGVILTSLSFAKTVVEPQFAVALAQENVNTIAEQITVMIDGPGDEEQSKGSGVIIGREGNIYYVLTNRHVVEKDGDYQVQTIDRTRYLVNYRQIQKLPGLDLAVVQFTSNQNYRVAKLGDSEKVSRRQKIYVVGYATPGVVFTARQFIPAEGIILDRISVSKDGYVLVYALNVIQPGMSGGPVLDEQGQLIGINGLAEPDVRTGRTDLIAGIPSNTFRNWQAAIVPVTTQSATVTSTTSPTTSSRFYCGMSNGQPATLLSSIRGITPLIIWEKPDLISGLSPEQRCEEISARFQRFYDSGSLRYLTTGTVGNQPVLCAVSEINTPCSLSNVLIPLSPGTDAKSVLKKFIDLNIGLSAGLISL
ncbi:hypothetical protein BCD67_07585 [Oscillatoriales cyanobacterium USR001]|nr:hypothetical protein BCD67_07585 [Oscillatoriales cyanobacterium USR001]